MNTIKTTLLLGLLTGLLVVMGQYVGGSQGAIVFFVIAMVINFASYWWSDTIVLKMYRAQPLERNQAPEIYRMVEDLTQRAGMPMPKLYILPQSTPNAFATGRNPSHAAVAVTQGIIHLLSEEELKGVLAHELSHIKHHDSLISTVAATIAGAITLIASILRYSLMFFGSGRNRNDNVLGMLVLSILAPVAAVIIQLAVSRSREFAADKGGAELAGSPVGLARALEKLERSVRHNPLQSGSYVTSHLFIVNPFRSSSLARLFSTHPSTEDRVKRLYALR
ncbi:MAG: zinc metalloprotease HtpX [Candidatus Auribacterota bacterium]|jgi:heat shock protein HtpX|nr:zinc metalloprotease HtpX [Candidatus Auribacterota bacterium]